jgi:hypothetical protein
MSQVVYSGFTSISIMLNGAIVIVQTYAVFALVFATRQASMFSGVILDLSHRLKKKL